MSLPPPKIDKRTYDDIVDNTVKLGQHYTAQVESELVDNKVALLCDRTLAEDITLKIAAGTLIDENLAEAIAKSPGSTQVKVKQNQQGGDRTLAEDITLNIPAGTLINERLAEAIAKSSGLPKVKVKQKGWWKPETVDAGLALIRIFGRMAAKVSDRLNQVPEKNFLAFLDLIGTQILPPQPARVPLTFSLATGAKVDTVVPARTQIAAPAPAGEQEEVVFETERDLVVTPVQLQAVFVRQPDTDCYSDNTQKATGIEDAAFSAFTAQQPIQQPIEHYLYLACDELFTLPAPKSITLTIASPDAVSLAALPITWSHWNGTTWEKLSNQPSNTATKPQWIVSFSNLPALTPCKVNGLNAAWLRAKLNQSPLQSKTSSLHIEKITAQVSIKHDPLAAKLCFFNSTPIDLNKDFYPFGEQPRFNDTIYLALDEAFAKPNAKVTVEVNLSDPLPMTVNPSADLEIKWETWNGSDWDLLLTSSLSASTEKDSSASTEKDSSASTKKDSSDSTKKDSSDSTKKDSSDSTKKDSSDSTKNFTQSGLIIVKLPLNVAAKTINGESNYWLRARITKGNYGTAASSTQRILYDGSTKLSEASTVGSNQLKVDDATGFQAGNLIWIEPNSNKQENHEITGSETQKLTLKTNLVNQHQSGTSILRNPYFIYDPMPATFGPPSLQSLKLGYSYDPSVPVSLSACLTYNDFTYKDVTYIDRTSEASKDNSSFSPFTPTDDKQPSLYLGFDQPFPNKPVALFAQVEPLTPEEATAARPTTTVPRLVWEYFSPSGWMRLGVQDETNAFAESGMIRFIGPPDFTARSEFGQSLYWLRVRKESGEFRVPPRLRRMLTNTTWASQATTIINQILGSSDGNPNQTFRTTNSPILLGQRLEVQEREILSPVEQSAIEQLEGADAVTILRDQTGNPEEIWVRWHEVADFYGSEKRDRHYTINHLTGEVKFGDGQQGMIPPQGRSNIRSLYRIGGGKRGNQAAKTVTQMKTTVPYIDSVTNLEAAGGGADLEPLKRVKERGPQVLRHRGRAVTVQDFEDLAYEASPDVARAKAIAPGFRNQKDSPMFDPLDPKLWLDSSDPKAMEKALPQHNEVKALNAGQVTLLIVPNSQDQQPVPSLALIERVETYIRARCNPTINLVVAGPNWQQVAVTVVVVPVSLDVADAVRTAVIKRLEEFLHPLTGGKQGQGWAFGRQPQMSDLYVVIEAVPGVDHIHEPQKLEVKLLPPQQLANQLVYSGSHTITLFEEGV